MPSTKHFYIVCNGTTGKCKGERSNTVSSMYAKRYQVQAQAMAIAEDLAKQTGEDWQVNEVWQG